MAKKKRLQMPTKSSVEERHELRHHLFNNQEKREKRRERAMEIEKEMNEIRSRKLALLEKKGERLATEAVAAKKAAARKKTRGGKMTERLKSASPETKKQLRSLDKKKASKKRSS